MRVLFINRHGLAWATGPDGAYLPVPPDGRSLLTRRERGGLDGWTAESFPDLTICDMSRPGETLRAGRELVRDRRIDRVVSVHETEMLTAAQLRDEFSLPGMAVAETLPFRDKVVMKQRLLAAGYTAVPRFVPLDEFGSVTDLPWQGLSVVKSRTGLGALQVRYVSTDEEVRSAVAELGAAPQDLEIEEYIDGTMYHCDSVVHDGQILFTSVSEYLKPPGGFGRFRYQGSVIVTEGETRRELLTHNEALLTALGRPDCVTHAEFFSTGEGIVFCEVAARPGGGGIKEIVQSTYGVNLVEASIHGQLGLTPAAAGTLQSPPAIHGVIGIFPGAFDKPLADTLSTVDGLLDYSFTEQPRDRPVHSTDYQHRVVLRATDRFEFDERADRVLSAAGALDG